MNLNDALTTSTAREREMPLYIKCGDCLKPFCHTIVRNVDHAGVKDAPVLILSGDDDSEAA